MLQAKPAGKSKTTKRRGKAANKNKGRRGKTAGRNKRKA
jgi:hypothetical protein